MNNYLKLKEKLISTYSKNIDIKDFNIEKKMRKLIKQFNLISNPKEIKKLLKEKIVCKYEETKENITFVVLIERVTKKFVVSLIICDEDFTYSNLLVKESNSLTNAIDYFNKLKEIIKNNNLETLSLYIINHV